MPIIKLKFELVISLLGSKIEDLIIKFQVEKINENFFRNLSPIAD